MASVLDSSGTPAAERTTSAPTTSTNGLSGNASPFSPLSSTLSSPGGTTGKAKGMQLGAHKKVASDNLSKMAAEWAEEAEAEAEGEAAHSQTWATDDLMDVNADQDDWSMSLFCDASMIVRY